MILCLLFQDSLFSIVGAFLYIASGSVAIDYWSLSQSISSSDNANAGFTMGSFCIITGKLKTENILNQTVNFWLGEVKK